MRKKGLILAHRDLYRNTPHGGEISMALRYEYLSSRGFAIDVLLYSSPILSPASYAYILTWGRGIEIAFSLYKRYGIPYFIFVSGFSLLFPSWPTGLSLCEDLDPFRFASRIIVPSRHMQRLLAAHSFDSLLLYPPLFLSPPSLPASRKFIVSVGDREDSGHTLLQSLAHILPHRQFLLLGDSKIRGTNISSSPFINRHLMLAITALMIGIRSFPETYGRCLREALVCGIPVLSDGYFSRSEQIPACFITRSKNPHIIARRIERIFSVYDDYVVIAKKAGERIKRRYNRDLRRLEELIKEVL